MTERNMNNQIEVEQQRFDRLEGLDFAIQMNNILISSHLEGHKRNNFNDANSILLSLGIKFLEISNSFRMVCANRLSIPAGILLRSMVDYMTVTFIIFSKSDTDEILFRYYLYCLDDIKHNKGRDKTTEVDITGFEQFIEQLLDEHPYKTINHNAFDEIKKNCNWKYKRFLSKAEYNGKNQYSWKEMYEELTHGNTELAEYYSGLSSYVHGLCYCLLIGGDKTTLNDFIDKAISIVLTYRKLLDLIYSRENNNLILHDAATKEVNFNVLFKKYFEMFDTYMYKNK